MDGELSGLNELRTDRIVGVNPKGGRRQGNGKEFENHLARSDDSEDTPDQDADRSGPHAEGEDVHRKRTHRGKVIDYTA